MSTNPDTHRSDPTPATDGPTGSDARTDDRARGDVDAGGETRRGDGSPDHPSRWPGRVLDAAAVKVLAHPLRFRMVDLLAELGPSTASALGRAVGENSGTTSYHLRQLAAQGIIEEAAELGTGRDRYWRIASDGITLDAYRMMHEQPETRPDIEQYLDEVVSTGVERLQRWHREGGAWPQEWVDASLEMTSRVRLTRTQLAELTRELQALASRFHAEQVGDDEPESSTVAIQIQAFPIEAPPARDPEEGSA